ncbi:MAG: carboxypeptidase regulatory-like domain-containing protein [Terracidiphilus sp.]
MFRFHWILLSSLLCFYPSECGSLAPVKVDPSLGTVTGIVLCADTGKPARFAEVTLVNPSEKDGSNASGGSAVTGLDGRFKIVNVAPGHYYAVAELEGYLNLDRAIDYAQASKHASEQEQMQEVIEQWKDHLTEVNVEARGAADLSLQVERGAEITGTVSYDDGNPAIGMHFQLLRRTVKNGWSKVGASSDSWAISEVSDGHGRFNLTNLPGGEYTVCASMPVGNQDEAPRICLGNTYRMKEAASVTVQAGDISRGADLVIPLNGLHTVAGSVTAAADGHALARGTLRLLYADDREKVREIPLLEDGSFSFPYVPEGSYILQVTGAQDAEQKPAEPSAGEANSAPKAPAARIYLDKELPLAAQTDMKDIQMQLAAAPLP